MTERSVIASASSVAFEPPRFATVEEERVHRKGHLAVAYRLFAHTGYDHWVAGHITVRDPEFPDRFWVNLFGRSWRHLRASDLLLVDIDGNCSPATVC
jgi:ribulose-5-phosphate 4-epimerase/fuculose-1-phosphate aldolase